MIGGGGAIPMRATRLPATASQGAMVTGNTHPAAIVEYAGRTLRVTPYGTFVFGIGRDATGDVMLRIRQPATGWIEHRLTVTARDWPVERINGVPPATVNPPKAIAERIEREQTRVVAVRTRDDARTGFAQAFIWPVQGRISGRFGNQRVYNGTPKSPHSGMDIAVATGTPVKAPADGVITFADPGLYLTGGTVVLDHGHGISSNFLHLSRIDAKVGDVVKQGRHRCGGRHWARNRAAPALGDELVRYPHRPVAGARTQLATHHERADAVRARRPIRRFGHSRTPPHRAGAGSRNAPPAPATRTPAHRMPTRQPPGARRPRRTSGWQR